MNTTKKQLMERAGLTNEAELNFLPLDDTTHHIVFNKPEDAERKLDSADIDYDNVGFVFPKMTRETWMTIKDLFDTRDVGDMGQHNESVKENSELNELQFDEDDVAAAKAVFSKIELNGKYDAGQAMEDGYYALTDNLPNLINDLQKALKSLTNGNEYKLIQKEIKIFEDIQALLDKSVLGAVL